jgi:hypothetical protein
MIKILSHFFSFFRSFNLIESKGEMRKIIQTGGLGGMKFLAAFNFSFSVAFASTL